MKILVVIPARGGSKGIPRKNIRFMAGQPLIAYAIQTALKSSYNPDVIVTSDDDEIKNVAALYGAEIIDRPSELGGDSITLDPVVFHAVGVAEIKNNCVYDFVITMQPTSPKLSVETLDRAIDYCISNDLDTVLSGVNDPRLSWHIIDGKCIPNYSERLNRQYMPKELKETGAFVISRRSFVTAKSRFGDKISIFEVPENESGDIDTVQDWCLAEIELKKKMILIRVDGYREIGMGHIYRGLQLAYGLIEHDVRFVINHKSELGIDKIKNSGFKYDVISNNDDILNLIDQYGVDIVINDILDTDSEYIQRLKTKEVRVINFEDMGTGAAVADATINALYDGQSGKNLFWGADYYLIRDEFVLAKPKAFEENVKNILVLFGGTDPNNLTFKTLSALQRIALLENIKVTVILGFGYSKVDEIIDMCSPLNDFCVVQNVKMMSEYMSLADIAVSSQGRTMLELAAMGVPTILMSQNEREANHEFGGIKNGYLNLGFGADVEIDTIAQTVEWLIKSPQIRKNMHEQMLTRDLRHGMNRVKKIVLGENQYD